MGNGGGACSKKLMGMLLPIPEVSKLLLLSPTLPFETGDQTLNVSQASLTATTSRYPHSW
jgi:hypothetical protein